MSVIFYHSFYINHKQFSSSFFLLYPFPESCSLFLFGIDNPHRMLPATSVFVQTFPVMHRDTDKAAVDSHLVPEQVQQA